MEDFLEERLIGEGKGVSATLVSRKLKISCSEAQKGLLVYWQSRKDKLDASFIVYSALPEGNAKFTLVPASDLTDVDSSIIYSVSPSNASDPATIAELGSETRSCEATLSVEELNQLEVLTNPNAMKIGASSVANKVTTPVTVPASHPKNQTASEQKPPQTSAGRDSKPQKKHPFGTTTKQSALSQAKGSMRHSVVDEKIVQASHDEEMIDDDQHQKESAENKSNRDQQRKNLQSLFEETEVKNGRENSNDSTGISPLPEAEDSSDLQNEDDADLEEDESAMHIDENVVQLESAPDPDQLPARELSGEPEAKSVSSTRGTRKVKKTITEVVDGWTKSYEVYVDEPDDSTTDGSNQQSANASKLSTPVSDVKTPDSSNSHKEESTVKKKPEPSVPSRPAQKKGQKSVMSFFAKKK